MPWGRHARNVEDMLIVEELHLLLTNPAGTPEQSGAMRGYGAAAALITDLLLAGRVALTDEKRPRVHVVFDAPTGNAVLDAGLQRLRERNGKRLDSLVTWSKLDLQEQVIASLVQAGVLVLGEPGGLGFGKPRGVERDPMPEGQLRARIAAVLSGAAWPTVADATLLAILQGLGVAHRILYAESGGMRAGDLKRRITQIVAHSPAGSAVDKAVQAMNAALMTTIFVAVIMPGMTAGS